MIELKLHIIAFLLFGASTVLCLNISEIIDIRRDILDTQCEAVSPNTNTSYESFYRMVYHQAVTSGKYEEIYPDPKGKYVCIIILLILH